MFLGNFSLVVWNDSISTNFGKWLLGGSLLLIPECTLFCIIFNEILLLHDGVLMSLKAQSCKLNNFRWTINLGFQGFPEISGANFYNFVFKHSWNSLFSYKLCFSSSLSNVHKWCELNVTIKSRMNSMLVKWKITRYSKAYF